MEDNKRDVEEEERRKVEDGEKFDQWNFSTTCSTIILVFQEEPFFLDLHLKIIYRSIATSHLYFLSEIILPRFVRIV